MGIVFLITQYRQQKIVVFQAMHLAWKETDEHQYGISNSDTQHHHTGVFKISKLFLFIIYLFFII